MQEQSVKNQYFAALVVNLLTIGWGVTVGWTSPSIVLLTSTETPLRSGKITMIEASWIASLLCVGGFIGNIFFGFVTGNFGRKLPMMLISIPTTISWMLIWFAPNVYWLYLARVLNGFVGGGTFALVPTYLAEIANDNIRGFLGSTLILNVNVGMLIAFLFGNFFDFYTTPKFVICLTILFAGLMSYLPETPSFLIQQNKVSEAKKSVQFYQNITKENGSHMLEIEMSKLRGSASDVMNEKRNKDSMKWSDLVSGTGRKAMTIGIVLAALNQFSGCFAMLNYTANIFAEAGSKLSPNVAAIIVGVIQLIGSYVATALVDRTGRKFLFIVSTIGTAFGLITLGFYMMLKSWQFKVDPFSWIPIASFSFVIFIASWAILSLPFLVISEVLPQKLKNVGVSFCMTLVWSFAFIILKYLPLLTETFGFHETMFLFASVCLTSALFIILCMPETKGKSYEQIMNSL